MGKPTTQDLYAQLLLQMPAGLPCRSRKAIPPRFARVLHVLHGARDSRFGKSISLLLRDRESIAGFDFVPYPEQGLVKKRPSGTPLSQVVRKRRQNKAVFGECSKRTRRLIADQCAAAGCF